MFLDINGNTFSTLANTSNLPVITHNPLQLFGSNLKLWVDFTDKTSLFTDTACTTNVTTFGDYILGIVDKSLNRKKLQKVNTTITASTDYQWSSNTFNNLAGALKTFPQVYNVDVGFHHEDATFLTANTNYSFHFVGRLQGNTQNPGLYSYGFLNNELRISAGFQRIDFINSSNQNNIIHNVSFLGLQISSVQFNFGTEFYESFGNNTYYQPTTGSAAGLNYSNGKFRLFSRYGSSPPLNTSPVQGFYCQELYIVEGLVTTEQLNLTHQYLRLKYGFS